MTTPLVVNGVTTNYPTNRDNNWGDEATTWATLVSNSTLQLTAGDFSITNELNLGPNFGLTALNYSSRTANPASSGILRLANTDSINWRNGANDGDLLLNLIADRLAFDGTTFITAGSTDILTNKTIDVDLNTITNIETDNFKAGVIKTDFTTPLDTEIPSALATSTEIDSRIVTERDTAAILTNKTLTAPVINTPVISDQVSSGGTITGATVTGGTVSSNTTTGNIRLENNTQTTAGTSVIYTSSTETTQRINASADFELDVQALQSGQEVNVLFQNTTASTITVSFTGVNVTGGSSNGTQLALLSNAFASILMYKFDDVTAGTVLSSASPTSLTKTNAGVGGTYTWEAPVGVSTLTLCAAGAGGGGGNFSFGNNVSTQRACSGGGGGGGGAFLNNEAVAVVAGQTYTFSTAEGTTTAAGADTTISGNLNGSAGTITLTGGAVGGDGFTADDNTTGGAGGAGGASVTSGGETTTVGANGGAGGGTTSGSASGQNGIAGGSTTVNSVTVAGGAGGAGGAARRRGGGGGGGASLLGAGAGGPGDQNATAGNSGGGGGGGGFLAGTDGGTGVRGTGGNGGFSISYLLPIGSADTPLVGP